MVGGVFDRASMERSFMLLAAFSAVSESDDLLLASFSRKGSDFVDPIFPRVAMAAVCTAVRFELTVFLKRFKNPFLLFAE